jgi:hypothetical protein
MVHIRWERSLCAYKTKSILLNTQYFSLPQSYAGKAYLGLVFLTCRQVAVKISLPEKLFSQRFQLDLLLISI